MGIHYSNDIKPKFSTENIFMGVLKKFNSLLCKIEQSLISLLLVVMFVCGLLQVYSRFVLKSPISWSEELLTYLFSWVCFIGTSLAVSTKSHFSVDLLISRFSPKMSRYIEIFVYLIIFFLSLFLIAYGLEAANANKIQRMNILPLSLFWGYIILPISGFFIAIHTIYDILNTCYPQTKVDVK